MKETLHDRQAEHYPVSLSAIEAQATALQIQLDRCANNAEQRRLANVQLYKLNELLEQWIEGEGAAEVIIAGQYWAPEVNSGGVYIADTEALCESPIQGTLLAYKTYEFEGLDHTPSTVLGRQIQLESSYLEGRTFTRAEEFFAFAPIATSNIITPYVHDKQVVDRTPKDSIQRDILHIFHRYEEDGSGLDLEALAIYFAELQEKDPNGALSNDLERYVDYLNQVTYIEGQETRLRAGKFYEYSGDDKLKESSDITAQGTALGFLFFQPPGGERQLSFSMGLEDGDVDVFIVVPVTAIEKLKFV